MSAVSCTDDATEISSTIYSLFFAALEESRPPIRSLHFSWIDEGSGEKKIAGHAQPIGECQLNCGELFSNRFFFWNRRSRKLTGSNPATRGNSFEVLTRVRFVKSGTFFFFFLFKEKQILLLNFVISFSPFQGCGLSLLIFSSEWPVRHFSSAVVAVLADVHVPVAAGRPAALFPSPFDVSDKNNRKKKKTPNVNSNVFKEIEWNVKKKKKRNAGKKKKWRKTGRIFPMGIVWS